MTSRRAFLLLPAAAGACAPACRGLPGTSQVTVQLLLGGNVADVAWQEFLASEVTPRFPAGLTVLAADGQWRDPAGRQVREHSRVLLIVMPREPAAVAAVEAVAEAYKRRFSQQSVGVVFNEACAAF